MHEVWLSLSLHKSYSPSAHAINLSSFERQIDALTIVVVVEVFQVVENLPSSSSSFRTDRSRSREGKGGGEGGLGCSWLQWLGFFRDSIVSQENDDRFHSR